MIVFDSSTLILVAKIEVLGVLLESMGFEVIIPNEVAQESCALRRSLDALVIQKEIEETRIRVAAVRDRKFVAKLERDFGIATGEAEAIALAQLERASIVGIDDKNGINACKLLGIPFTTAIGILVRLREKALLTNEEAVIKLAQLGNHGRYKQTILDNARHQLEALND